MSGSSLWSLALFIRFTMAQARYVCDGNMGPDFFNVSAVLDTFATRQLQSKIFFSPAQILTEFQESILEFICLSGFKVSDNCGMHRPGDEKENTQARRCPDASEDGLGTIYTSASLVHMTASDASCCGEGSWQHLLQLLADFRSQDMSSNAVGHWKDFLFEQLENIFGIDMALFQANQEIKKLQADAREGDLLLLKECWSCYSAYEMLKVIAGSAKMLTWGHVYESARRHGVTTVEDFQYEPWRGVHHVLVVHSLLKELEANPDLWITPTGKSSPEFRAVEIGVHQGLSSLRLLHWQPNLTMLLVDPYSHVMASGDKYTELLGTDPDDDLRLLRRGMAPYTEANRASILATPSVLAASWIQDESVALVFIDGDHSSAAVIEDVRAWLPKVRPGGVIAGHDYHPFESWGNEAFSSVAAGVKRTLPPGRQLHLAVAGVWWWIVHPGDAQTIAEA